MDHGPGPVAGAVETRFSLMLRARTIPVVGDTVDGESALGLNMWRTTDPGPQLERLNTLATLHQSMKPDAY